MANFIRVKTISRFGILELKEDVNRHFKNNNNLRINEYFWCNLFDQKFLESFLYKDYLKQKKKELPNIDYKELENEIKFLLSKLNYLKSKINFHNEQDVPKGEDIFFSFRIFSAFLFYINDFFIEDNIFLGLREGLVFKEKNQSIKDLIKNIDYYKNTKFVDYLISPLLKKLIENRGDNVYVFEIFWPDELVLVGILGSLLKEIDKNAKIAIDFSIGNEQFDFTQRVNLIKKSEGELFKYYDYFIVDRDFGLGIKNIKDYYLGKIQKKDIKNVVFYDKKVHYNEIKKSDLPNDMFEEFINTSFDKNKTSRLFGKKSIYARFLPYKCYWSECNFCAINSQNKFTYNNDYSYDYFINKRVEFIKENNIFSLNFKDEAIPPRVIVKFAKEIIKNKLKINYQFRTRYDKYYTYKNCKILADSGCGFCGIGLESAVDRVNEKIANKGNIGITIKDKLKIIHNFDKAGVSFHNYAIMGFPGETDKEIITTYKFLKTNIINSNHFTCSPNIYGLMKGTRIFNDRKEFGIDIKKSDLENPFNLNYEFKYKGKLRNFNLLKKIEEDLHKTQFLPWLDSSSRINGRAFWNYIDRAYVFYLLKRFHKINPFYSYKNINKDILEKDYKEIINEKFSISKYFQLYKNDKLSNVSVYDWCSDSSTVIDIAYLNFLENYDDNLSLKSNIDKLIITEQKTKETILLLLRDKILLLKK